MSKWEQTALRLEKNEAGYIIVKKPKPEKEKVRFSNVKKTRNCQDFEKYFQA